jgi:pyruvate dehydrogenase E2 component (dihydrolipoamide acetyltransferase)
MAKEIRLPKLGQTMEEGTIVGCNIKVGDAVKKGDCIFEIETDKATLEMESPADGFVKNILVQIGQTLPVGEPILVLGEKDEVVPQTFIDSLKGGVSATITAQPQPAPQSPVQQPQVQVEGAAEKVIASPRAKKLAKELGVDLSTVTGTGPGGRITEDDVKNASTKPAVSQPAAEIKLGATIPLNRLQKITAERMLKSKREIPCFYLTVKADVTDLVEFRTKLNASGTSKVAYNDFIIKAVAAGLEKFPIMTGQLVGETIQLAASIDIGLAMSVPEGLIVPIVRNANKKTVAEISSDTQGLIEKARIGKLLLTDLEGGCITVSNLGAFGVESFIPIVVPGQCSILGVGQITDTCVPDDGGFTVCKFLTMTLSVDHKVANGAYAAQFLDFVRKYLENISNFK